MPLIIAGAGKPRGRVDAIVEHVDLVAGLVGLADGQRTAGATGTDLWTIMDGRHDHVNTALSENTMYGPGKASIVDETARLSRVRDSVRLHLACGCRRCGAKARVGRGPAGHRQAPESSGEGQARRLMPIEGAGGVTIQDNEMFNQLLSLGYIDGPEPDKAEASESSASPESATTP